MVDADGFADLLDHYPAVCRNLKQAPHGSKVVLVLPEVGDGVLGGPLTPRNVGSHDPVALDLDLSQLDRGTEAHERTLRLLIQHLHAAGRPVRGPARTAPKFDAGWTEGDNVFIAEVKSLSERNETQQIRLGIGQVLDYAHAVAGSRTHGLVRSVLVLSKRPSEARWSSVCSEQGITLTWAPDFPGF